MRRYPATLTLTDQYDSLVIRPETPTGADPIWCREWDLGAPEIREATAPRSGSDGDIDRTTFTGARTATFDLAVQGDDGESAYSYVDRLAAMTHPSRRPSLYVSRGNPEATGEIWELGLRGTPFSVTYGRRSAAMIEVQLSFNAPLGLLLGPWRGLETVNATAATAEGISFPTSLPWLFEHGNASQPYLDVIVGGSAPIHPVVYIYGPVTNPEVMTEDGERFKFRGLGLNTGRMVQIDMGESTVRMEGLAGDTMWHLVDWDVSTFWRWQPGPHTVRFLSESGRLGVQWRERRLHI